MSTLPSKLLRVSPQAAALARGQVLVIINAIAAEQVDYENWTLPARPAFTRDEVDAVTRWVEGGGALLLVADHMPFPGAAAELARRFGIHFTNGFAIDTTTWDPIVHRRSDGTLIGHPITDGAGPAERVDSVATFWGQAFRADPGVAGLMRYGAGVISFRPERAWQFTDQTPVDDVQGWLQGAALTRGAGRVVVLGEAGMLSAQLMGPRRRPAGMNAPSARQNPQFVLNLMRWLAGTIQPLDIQSYMWYD
jgi:hypothetical protein